jgi:hypothetical protein
MFGITKIKFKRSLRFNSLIHDIIIAGLVDKYIEEENLKSDYELQLLGRSLNWAVPNLYYDFENDIEKVDDEYQKIRLKENNDQVFLKGIEILNSDPIIERLILYYIAYELYLVKNLKYKEEKYPGIRRMKKYLFQTLEKEPDISSQAFKEEYKNLFIVFNKKYYGKYGKSLSDEKINSMYKYVF